MKTLARLLNLSFIFTAFSCEAQTLTASHLKSVSDAKVLAIGTFVGPPTREQLATLSVLLYQTGKVDQWYSPQDGHGVVWILNLSSVDEAHAMLEALPFGKPTVMTF